ncbi:MAG: site-specific DNA-methyltransferase [Actinomycetota bacterium]|nr:site-specific DNA-methyltransferase [Actinomycetota bacterium]
MTGRRRATATSAFGVGKRENHDASGFYARFTPPVVSKDEVVNPCPVDSRDKIHRGDSRQMDQVPDGSVALVVTSPPYFAGKEYEAALGQGHIPASYFEYLDMLEAVFRECVRKLEPGGRIAVNVANLGRRPYRSLAGDVTAILQDRLGLLLRGEIVWQKARGATGSTAWGSFQSASNPVLRDITERVVVASKGRFDRAIPRPKRERAGLPSVVTAFKDEFMDATLDLWEIPPESATRVNHPAPFPVELPLRLIHLYTFKDDLVLDPFMGSGTTAVAAIQAGRHFVGYDTDGDYVRQARQRVKDERARLRSATSLQPFVAEMRFTPAAPADGEDFQQRAVREGKAAKEIARALLEMCGFTGIRENVKLANGVEVNFTASDATGADWYFDVSGAFTSTRPGLRRTDTVWKALGKLAVLSQQVAAQRIVLLTTDLPPKGSAGDAALRSARLHFYRDAFEMLSLEAQQHLKGYALGLDGPYENRLDH